LGFLPLQAEPHRTEWRFTDSDGHVHAGSAWAIDMVKPLANDRESFGSAHRRRAGSGH
jgi:hypothetical protein